MARQEIEKKRTMLTQQPTHGREGRSSDGVRGSRRDNGVSTINTSDRGIIEWQREEDEEEYTTLATAATAYWQRRIQDREQRENNHASRESIPPCSIERTKKREDDERQHEVWSTKREY
jgi:hypothetical protein